MQIIVDLMVYCVVENIYLTAALDRFGCFRIYFDQLRNSNAEFSLNRFPQLL